MTESASQQQQTTPARPDKVDGAGVGERDNRALQQDLQQPAYTHQPSLPSSPSAPTSQQQQQQYLQAGAISPGVTFSDDQYELYDSDMEPELDLGPSRETLHEGQILKSGFLHKKGERLKIWKKKWFVLRTSKLAYYKDSKEYELLRIIDIRDIHKAAEVVVKNRTGVFVILTPRRTFTVQADSVAEMEQWIHAINQAKVQHDLTSSSDIDSYSGSTPQLENVSTSAPSGFSAASRRPELVKQASGTLLPPRKLQQTPNPLSFSDPGLLASGENAARLGAYPRIPESRISGLSLGIMSQSVGQLPSSSSPANGAHNSNNAHIRPGGADTGLSLVTSGVQAIRIGGPPSSPPRDELPPNSFSSSHSLNAPGTPNSPGYGSGCEQYGSLGDCPNASSEEEDVVDDPSVLEAGRVAAAANAPGSGLVTGEQLESKVIRQGYLLKLGKTYKTWRKKWFVLRGDKLTYYKNTKEYQPHGIIPLSTIIDCLQTDPVSKHKQYCLRIVTSKKSFVCCAPDEDTLLQWLDALHVECARVAKEAQQEEDDDVHGTVPTTTTATAAATAQAAKIHLMNEEDNNLLADPRAMGRTAHMDINGGGGTGGLLRAGSSSAFMTGGHTSIPGSSAGLLSTSPMHMPPSSSPSSFATSPSRPTVTFSA
ncbi:hypothetical protein BGZ72_009171 [Mortierella alpina]|nr:hypothetical protein BGZ72_009171 [Mortierella alpina]